MSYLYSGVDLRKDPEEYEIGREGQGVFHAKPYKNELLPLWSFKDVAAAKNRPTTSTSASCITRRRGTSWGWTSRGTACRWVTPGRGATRGTGARPRASPWRSPILRS